MLLRTGSPRSCLLLHLLNQDLLVADDVDALANLFEALACGVVDGNVLFCGFNLINACQDVEQVVVEVQADAIEGGVVIRVNIEVAVEGFYCLILLQVQATESDIAVHNIVVVIIAMAPRVSITEYSLTVDVNVLVDIIHHNILEDGIDDVFAWLELIHVGLASLNLVALCEAVDDKIGIDFLYSATGLTELNALQDATFQFEVEGQADAPPLAVLLDSLVFDDDVDTRAVIIADFSFVITVSVKHDVGQYEGCEGSNVADCILFAFLEADNLVLVLCILVEA